MKYRDAFNALFAIALALFSLAGIAASGQAEYGSAALHAEAVGFDALAHQMFGGDACI